MGLLGFSWPRGWQPGDKIQGDPKTLRAEVGDIPQKTVGSWLSVSLLHWRSNGWAVCWMGTASVVKLKVGSCLVISSLRMLCWIQGLWCTPQHPEFWSCRGMFVGGFNSQIERWMLAKLRFTQDDSRPVVEAVLCSYPLWDAFTEKLPRLEIHLRCLSLFKWEGTGVVKTTNFQPSWFKTMKMLMTMLFSFIFHSNWKF